MARVKDNSSIAPPLTVIMGRQEPASYRTQLVPEFNGHPLIEPLPPIWPLEHVTELLSHYPEYSEKHRMLPAEIRLHMLDNAREFFVPQGTHLEIHISISNMLRRGYLVRNPLERGYWRNMNEKLEQFKKHPMKSRFLQAKARGFCIVGIGGIGKSTTVENILSLYPQVIIHTHYCGEDFIQKQLVWLKIQCPNDGSIKGLCLNFFETVDAILETDYAKRYGGRYRTVDELLPNMARVAALHCLGVLVIDEIQDLSEAKSGGAARVLNFLVQLENTIGVPYLLIGTPKANQLFKGEFRQARRASEQGDVNWQRMAEFIDGTDKNGEAEINPIWEEFIRALWTYQYVVHPSPLQSDLRHDPLSHALYDESQGITAVAVTLYVLAQRRAITSRTETITAGIIRSVARDSQNQIRDYIEQIRQGAITAKRRAGLVSDLGGVTLVPHVQHRNGKQISEYLEISKPESENLNSAASSASTRRRKPKNVSDASPPARKIKQSKVSSKQILAEDDLRNLGPQEETMNKTDNTRLRKHIRTATEFLDG
jgi:ABC-type oligopeptide transport system ATPase subunit